MEKSLIIHGHFYQPPRENPWTDRINRQPSARPFHDWNERITSECYRPNAHARVLDGYGRVERIVNNYTALSFNFGPTLMRWLEQFAPETYSGVIAADRLSAERCNGHGNAMAQAYHHAILPLCNERDLRTEIRWGLTDFKARFGRDAQSMWLPETACNQRVLAALIEAGLKFVVLSPYQAERVRPLEGGKWRDVSNGSVDSSLPFAFKHPDGSGRTLAVYFYDGQIARAIAFEGALASSEGLFDRFDLATRSGSGLVNVATDGESYGHHFHFGDRTLAYALEVEAKKRGFTITNYADHLARNEPGWEVEIKAGPDGEGTAWSCAHGVGRWTRDCGCNASAGEGWAQAWRKPLRKALELLRDYAAVGYQQAAQRYFKDPWAARDAYADLVVNAGADKTDWLTEQMHRTPTAAEQVTALSLLEMQRSALMMFTSCGWFFNDISGIETQQILMYAARLLDQLQELGLASPRAEFLNQLALAVSNIPAQGTGADVFRSCVQQFRVSPQQVAAHVAITGLVTDVDDADTAAGYRYERTLFQLQRHGRLTMSTSKLSMTHETTGVGHDYAVGAICFGDVDFYCVAQKFPGLEKFSSACELLWSNFRTASLPLMLRLAQEQFGSEEFGLDHLLEDGRERISQMVFGHMVERFSETYEKLYDDNRRNIDILLDAGFALPSELRAAAEFTVARRLVSELLKQRHSYDATALAHAWIIAREVTQHEYRLHRTAIVGLLEEMITEATHRAVAKPNIPNLKFAISLASLVRELKLEINVEGAQEAVYGALLDTVPDPHELHELAVMLNVSPILLRPELLIDEKPAKV